MDSEKTHITQSLRAELLSKNVFWKTGSHYLQILMLVTILRPHIQPWSNPEEEKQSKQIWMWERYERSRQEMEEDKEGFSESHLNALYICMKRSKNNCINKNKIKLSYGHVFIQ